MRIRAAGIALFFVACQPTARTVHEAARDEVFSTSTCADIEVSHVPAWDVASERDDVYLAEGCGFRWRMTCGSERVRTCPRRSQRSCSTHLRWACANIQPDEDDHS